MKYKPWFIPIQKSSHSMWWLDEIHLAHTDLKILTLPVGLHRNILSNLVTMGVHMSSDISQLSKPKAKSNSYVKAPR